jgi:hypothetical protein
MTLENGLGIDVDQGSELSFSLPSMFNASRHFAGPCSSGQDGVALGYTSNLLEGLTVR